MQYKKTPSDYRRTERPQDDRFKLMNITMKLDLMVGGYQ